MPRSRSRRRRASALVTTGLVVVVIGFLQPWASCPEIDDSSAGCPAGVATRIVMAAGLVLAGIGAALFAAGVAATRRRTPGNHG